ncbi:MAG: class I tRNA ligase family protein [Planctomycetota bacterium]|nr:class I tRNA ligase family protein [Planctomycetota bacterium]
MSFAPYYVTTPIYYVNDRPHIGHCYTTMVADAVARTQRLIRGEAFSPDAIPGTEAYAKSLWARNGRAGTVFLLTGTDEHADKVVTSAAERGRTPQEWADINAAQFRAAFEEMDCAFDDFIRTTEARHKDKVPEYIRALMDTGDVYRGEYTGWYDQGQEEYVPENTARENDYVSTISKKPLVKRTEPCYFFRLSKFQQRLLDQIQNNPTFVMPEARRQEVLGRLRPPQVLHDVPISRPVTSDPSTQWGIRIPGDEENRVYVWIDALFNYFTAVDTPDRRHFWPPAVHMLGKDILWFHAVIWPALLMALNLPLPRTIFGHGWWISNGQKMSKSMGNFIDLERLQSYASRYSLDSLRWYLLTQGPLSGADADFSHAKFVDVYNADLANGIGNCASRVGNMIEKYFGSVPERPSDLSSYSLGLNPDQAKEYDFKTACAAATARYITAADAFDLAGALHQASGLVRLVDGYINVTAPFKLAKTVETDPGAKARLATILYACAETIRVASLMLSPALPIKMASLWQSWQCHPAAQVALRELAAFGGAHAIKPATQIHKGEPLFMRADPAEAAPRMDGTTDEE